MRRTVTVLNGLHQPAGIVPMRLRRWIWKCQRDMRRWEGSLSERREKEGNSISFNLDRYQRVSQRSLRSTLYQHPRILHLRLSSRISAHRRCLHRSVDNFTIGFKFVLKGGKYPRKYLKIVMTLTDIDECAIGNPCDGICRNTVGAFECLCAVGFQLNNDDQCVDIDECLNDPCEGICINTQGSYSCSCELGYQLGDNGTCSGKNKLSFQKKKKGKTNTEKTFQNSSLCFRCRRMS